jgi:hypothetical protein
MPFNLNRIESVRNYWLDPIDYPHDDRPKCQYCGNNFEPASSENDEYCSPSHWHLSQPGQEVQRQIDAWITQGLSKESILKKMNLYWFYWMTDSTVARWKRVIARKFEVLNGG